MSGRGKGRPAKVRLLLILYQKYQLERRRETFTPTVRSNDSHRAADPDLQSEEAAQSVRGLTCA